MNEYEVRVTRQALEQMKEIVHYISNDPNGTGCRQAICLTR